MISRNDWINSDLIRSDSVFGKNGRGKKSKGFIIFASIHQDTWLTMCWNSQSLQGVSDSSYHYCVNVHDQPGDMIDLILSTSLNPASHDRRSTVDTPSRSEMACRLEKLRTERVLIFHVLVCVMYGSVPKLNYSSYYNYTQHTAYSTSSHLWRPFIVYLM